ncbi:MAG: type II secretion system minor pseudopilin GspK [Pseudomonadota bacterium]
MARPRPAHGQALSPVRAPGRGVVLLSVLLIVALLSALAVRMTSRHSLIVAQARQVLGADVTLQYALGAEDFVRQLLFEDWERDTQPEKTDHLGDAWAQPLQPFELNEYEDAFLEIQIRDLGACFNLNSLAGEEGTEHVRRLRALLQALSLPPNIADLWLDWVDADEQITGFGAEDGEYLLEPVAYRAANTMAADPSELFLLKGVDPQQIVELLPHVCTLPTTELKINVNTATVPVLASVDPESSNEGLRGLTEQERRYTTVEEATNDYQTDLLGGNAVLDVKSRYFELRARVQIDDNVSEIASVLERNPETGLLRLLHRDFGRAFVSLYEADDAEDTN